MNMPPPTLSLDETLAQFRDKVNADSRLQSILRGWEPVIAVEVLDTGWKRYLLVRDCRIDDIRPDCADDSHVVHLLASEEVLTAVFDGRLNPTEAFLDGELQIFASDKDQVKLDAISLMLWGA
jgi:SCP-2 sterol transfer family